MPWFYYSGNVPRTMPVKKGVSVSVKPHTRVEIFDPTLREVQALQKKGLLRRTGRPPGAKSMAAIEPTTAADIKAVTPKSAMAQKIAEKGVTTDKGQAPKKPKGQPEMTEGERIVAEAKKVVETAEAEQSTNDESPEASTPDSSTESGDSPSGADLVDALSNADGSPDEDEEGDVEDSKKKKKRRRK